MLPGWGRTAARRTWRALLPDDELRASVDAWLGDVVRPYSFNPTELAQLQETVRRFLRTRSFLVRYFPLDAADSIGVIADALDRRHLGESLRERVTQFCGFPHQPLHRQRAGGVPRGVAGRCRPARTRDATYVQSRPC
jgi:hypothetical protein